MMHAESIIKGSEAVCFPAICRISSDGKFSWATGPLMIYGDKKQNRKAWNVAAYNLRMQRRPVKRTPNYLNGRLTKRTR